MTVESYITYVCESVVMLNSDLAIITVKTGSYVYVVGIFSNILTPMLEDGHVKTVLNRSD